MMHAARVRMLLAALLAPLLLAAAPALPPRDDAGFLHAVAPYTYAFPRDHASHPSYRTEWWYYTGHLQGARGRFGYELTFFRVGLPRLRTASTSAWAAQDLMFAHLALTDEAGRKFRYFDRVRRPSLGMAGADSTRYHVWLDDSYAQLAADGTTHVLRGDAPEFGFALELAPARPPVAHGEGGVSQKSAGVGRASHYYSLTRLTTRGTLRVAADSFGVTGQSWMDHEFGSGQMTGTHAGWDWFSLQLDDGRDLMLYRLRLKDGGVEPLSSGTLVERDGRARHLVLADFRITPTGTWTSPRTQARYPQGWTIELPRERLTVTLSAVIPDQELAVTSMGGVVYWEGAVRVRGTSRGVPVSGEGYAELTGYAGRAPF